MTDKPKEPKKRELEDGDTKCHLCHVLWPADALVDNLCPDCQPVELGTPDKSA